MKRYRETWVVKNRPGNVSALMREFGISDVCARILWNRGYETKEAVADFLYGSGSSVSLPKLPNEDAFLAACEDALNEGGRFRVIGDYDVDGVTATYLMVAALRLLGAEVDYRIPDRVADGYGISEEMVRTAAADGIRTIITVDNGIAAVAQIALAKELGLRVLVTDHHEPQAELPCADVIVDPKLVEGAERQDALCGAVVAGILADRLIANSGRSGFAASMMEVMALATVCDVMPLTGVARDIVRRGLAKPRDMWNPGLRTLAEANRLDVVSRCYHFGFVIGPCINALGRLETADYGVELLLATDPEAMRTCAFRMVEVNETRKEQTKHCTELAIAEAECMLNDDPDTSVLIICLPECHESIAGIVAGKVREQFCRPSFILTESAGGSGDWKGSGRSTESFSMFEAMMDCKDLFKKFGGHAMAAGLTIAKENIEAFRNSMEESFRRQGATTVNKVKIDLVMPFRYITTALVEELAGLEPFGTGNPKPVFAQKNVEIRSMRYIGKTGNFLSLKLRDAEGTEMSAVYFGDAKEFAAELAKAYGSEAEDELLAGRRSYTFDICYYPDKNQYNGREYLQVQISYYHFPEKDAR